MDGSLVIVGCATVAYGVTLWAGIIVARWRLDDARVQAEEARKHELALRSLRLEADTKEIDALRVEMKSLKADIQEIQFSRAGKR